MASNLLILKTLFLFSLPYYISTKFIKHQNGQESIHKKIDSKLYSLEMVNIPNLEPNINRNGLMQSSDNFIRRIPLYTYTPYFLGYLDEHEQIRKEKETFEESKRKSHYIPNKFDESEIREALTLKKNEEISNNKEIKFKNIINDDVDDGYDDDDNNIKEALEIIKKIAEQKTNKNHNKSKFKKSIKKYRNDDLITDESAENFNILKNNRPKPIKSSKTKKSILIENDDDDDDATSYLEIYNQNPNEKFDTPKRGKRFDEIIENNPYELLNALISHEIQLTNTNNNVDKNQGVCKYLELANILGCLGNKEKINNICKSILGACTCPACKQKKSASEIVFNYTNLTDSDSEEEKFYYDHSNDENKDSVEAHFNDSESFDKLLDKVSDQIEKNESPKIVSENKMLLNKDNDLNKNLGTTLTDGKAIVHTDKEKEVKMNENLSTEQNEKIHFIENKE